MFNKTDINRKYFEDKNFKRLMSRLYTYFSKSHDYKVGKDEEQLCELVMKSIYTHNNPSEDETRVTFIKRLNRLCYNELLQIVTNKVTELSEINTTQDLIRNVDISGDEGNVVQNSIANFPKPMMAGQQNNDVTDHYDTITKERSTEIQQLKKEIPKFDIEMDKNNQDILKAYEETQKKYEEDRKMFDASQKVITTEDGDHIPTTKKEPEFPLASNIDTDQDLLIQDNDAKIIDTKALAKNELLINQPKQFEEVINNIYGKTTKDYYIVIDSRDRNHDLFPNPNNYQVEFDNVLRSVISIELISAELPVVQYNINANNNILHFNEGGSTLVAEIVIGQYDAINDLRLAVQNALNAADGSSADYTVSISTITRKLTITKGSGTFGLEFVGDSEVFVEGQTRTKYIANSIGAVIGFSRSDLTGSLTYTGNNQYNLTGENYVLLYIKELENLESVSGNATIHDTFTKINLDSSSNNIKFYKQLDEYISRVTFTPPLASIGQMIIKFYNYNGTLYDFGGREHSLHFKITVFNQPMNYFQG